MLFVVTVTGETTQSTDKTATVKSKEIGNTLIHYSKEHNDKVYEKNGKGNASNISKHSEKNSFICDECGVTRTQFCVACHG